MQTAKTMKHYHKELSEAIENKFLRQTLDKFAVAYRANRQLIFADVNAKELIADIAAAKAATIGRYDELYDQFKAEAEKRGVIVHRAADGEEANRIICSIAGANKVKKIIKSKSMTGEEIHINRALEAIGCEVTETDLGEWIIQLRNEGPSHMVMPAIHLSRHQVADTFTGAVGEKQDSDIAKLVKVARRELRSRFAAADMGISGANFAIASSGTVAICTNEGNGRLTTTLPRVHVAICGIDKLVPSLHDAMRVLKVLPRNATSQILTSYVSWMTGATECTLNPDKKKIMHVVFLDNGRSALAKDPVCGPALNCVRCGACANVCPVFRLVGGHKMGHIYIGAIGLILTYFFHGHDKAGNLVQNCINCEACKDVCAAGIDLPAIIREIRARLNEEEGSPMASSLLAKVLANRKLFHTLLRFGKWAQRPVTGGTAFIRHLPEIFMPGGNFRALPAIAPKAFRDQWPGIKRKLSAGSKCRVGIFAGCAQDFVYPEQIRAAVEIFSAKGCTVEFPLEQSCCGLPVLSMGERMAAQSVAAQNVKAFAAGGYDYIVTLCASCASHIKNNYTRILSGQPELAADTARFVERIRDFSSFTRDVLQLGAPDLVKSGETVTYHAPCHLCRGLGVQEQPRALLADAAEYKPSAEEEVCCGFGGAYSVKFPEVSVQLLDMKLNNAEASGASTLVTDCPGCVMQLRGGEEKRGKKLKVEHMAEFLSGKLKK
ncbi:MAG: LUD domain-containing protein [Deltaproteobacteria bacterium]|jgi:iron-sulfur cluster protein|nr:LUD domain-containing protein [Deltaproteobacteria bacterium]